MLQPTRQSATPEMPTCVSSGSFTLQSHLDRMGTGLLREGHNVSDPRLTHVGISAAAGPLVGCNIRDPPLTRWVCANFCLTDAWPSSA